MAPEELESWITRIRNDDRVALAKAITLVESRLPDDRINALKLLSKSTPKTQSLRLAVTGPPGAGKSTLIEALGLELISKGLRVAVLTIDPSSPRTGGSILGDKTRMQQLSSHPDAFVRPSPSQGTAGGVAPRTHEAITLTEEAGYHVILVETVGVGQSEYAVAELTDAVLLVMIPGAGDNLQAIKRGILEVVDGIVINKSDGPNRPAAEQVRQETEQAVAGRTADISGEPVRVACCSARTHEGIPELAEYWIGFRTGGWTSAVLPDRRLRQARAWLQQELRGISEERMRRAYPYMELLTNGGTNEYEVLLHALA